MRCNWFEFVQRQHVCYIWMCAVRHRRSVTRSATTYLVSNIFSPNVLQSSIRLQNTSMPFPFIMIKHFYRSVKLTLRRRESRFFLFAAPLLSDDSVLIFNLAIEWSERESQQAWLLAGWCGLSNNNNKPKTGRNKTTATKTRHRHAFAGECHPNEISNVHIK